MWWIISDLVHPLVLHLCISFDELDPYFCGTVPPPCIFWTTPGHGSVEDQHLHALNIFSTSLVILVYELLFKTCTTSSILAVKNTLFASYNPTKPVWVDPLRKLHKMFISSSSTDIPTHPDNIKGLHQPLSLSHKWNWPFYLTILVTNHPKSHHINIHTVRLDYGWAVVTEKLPNPPTNHQHIIWEQIKF